MEEDERRILEREMYQIEQIRQLDQEELQIEEVDDLSDSSDDDYRYPIGGYVGVIFNSEFHGEITYDTCIPSLHTYLGDFEEKHHRTAFLDGGAVLNLPLLCLDGVVLFPGATLPLRVIGSNFVAAIERALNQVNVPYTIAAIQVPGDLANRRMDSVGIGTTAEIRQYGHLEDGSLNVVTCGQQRFRLRRCWIDVDGVTCGEIQIIEEDIPSRTPRGAFGKLTQVSNLPRSHATSSVLPSRYSPVKVGGSENGEYDSEESFESELSLKKRRIHQSIVCSSYGHDLDESSSSGDDKFTYESEQEIRSNLNDSYILRSLLSDHGKDAENLDSRIGNCSTSGKQFSIGKELSRCHKNIDAYSSHRISKAFWPHWVYRMFDSYWLAQRAIDMWKQIVGAPSMDALAKKPDVLSFYIASKIPVSVSKKQELLDIDGISHRLRREIELLENIEFIRCKRCQTIIAKRSDMLVMSSEGPLGASVNTSGYVHEIMTLFKTNGLALTGPAVTKYRLFPGYQRTIAKCVACETQMGWLFTAKNEKLKPTSFWGIRNCQVVEEMREDLHG